MMEPVISARWFNTRAGTLSCLGSHHSYIISEDCLEDEVRYNSIATNTGTWFPHLNILISSLWGTSWALGLFKAPQVILIYYKVWKPMM